MPENKADIIARLQKEILPLQGYKPLAKEHALHTALGPIKAAFPNGCFPLAAVHEFIAARAEEGAAATGFITGLLSNLVSAGGVFLWISSSRTLFPPALKSFGIEPDRCIFVDLVREKDVLWAMEEALKCGALSAVVGELRDISFTASRRLQLAVEQSQVTGFLLRRTTTSFNTLACLSRWQISPLPSMSEDDLPGIGFPGWSVQLLKIRNGRPGKWELQWADGKFQSLHPLFTPLPVEQKKTG